MKLNTLITDPTPLSHRVHAIVTVLTGLQTGRVITLEQGRVLSLGRSDTCSLCFEDASVSGKHASILGIAGSYQFIDEGSTNGSAVNGVRVAPHQPVLLNDNDRIQLGSATLLRFSMADDAEREALTRMYESAFRDALTGAFNRKHLDERLDAEIAFALRHGTELSILLFDVDRFKSVNDTHGHLAGDGVLRHAAQVLSRQLRAEDLFARYGGEEFVIVARGIPLASAVVLAERLRSALASSSLAAEGARPELRVTASCGVASLRCLGASAGEPARAVAMVRQALFSLADKRLYRAKEQGRNRVVGA